MAELALASQSSLLSYIVGSVTAPRATVRQLMAEPQLKSVVWRLVLVSAAVSAAATILAGLYEYLYRSFEPVLLPSDYPVADIFLWGVIELGLFIGSFLLIRFLWAYLFGYRNETIAIWAAAAMSCCLLMILDPLLEIAWLVQGDPDTASTFMVFGAYLLVFLLIVAIYFSAALVISYLKAVALALCALLVDLFAVTVILFGMIGIPILFSMQATQ